MGLIHEAPPALLLLAAFGREPKTLAWARNTATDAWGPVALTSDVFDFAETDYYEPTMGRGLKKVFLAFERTVDPARLPVIKRQTNGWEEDCARQYSGLHTSRPAILPEPLGLQQPDRPSSSPFVVGPHATPGHPAARPVNLDPGYLTEAKLVLASTKDHAHRIYLARGIYAEVTLHYQGGRWQVHNWTYPDYRRDDYHLFFTQCRDFLRRHAAESNAP